MGVIPLYKIHVVLLTYQQFNITIHMHCMYVQDKHMITINLLLGSSPLLRISGFAVCRDRHRYFENMSTRSHISSLSTETVRPFGLVRPPFHSTNYILVQSTDSEFFRFMGNQKALTSSALKIHVDGGGAESKLRGTRNRRAYT